MREVSFGPIQVKGLVDGFPFVKRCYGAEAMRYGFFLLNHQTFHLEYPRKFNLRKEEGSHCKAIKYDQETFDSWLLKTQAIPAVDISASL